MTNYYEAHIVVTPEQSLQNIYAVTANEKLSVVTKNLTFAG